MALRSYLLAVAVLAGCLACAGEALAPPGEWPLWRRDRRQTGHQPMPGAIRQPRVAWEHDLRGWEALIIVRPGKGPGELTLKGSEPRNPSYLDEAAGAWGLGTPRHDLAGDGRTVAVGPRHNSKIGKLLPTVKGLQQVEITEGRLPFGEETNQGWVLCYAHDGKGGTPRVAWKVRSVQKTHRPYCALADFDADGDLDVVHSDWGQLSAYDGQSGRVVGSVHWLDRRHRGVLIAQDIDEDPFPEFVVIGHFHMNVSAIDNDGKRLKVLWCKEYERQIEVQDRIVRAPRHCLADLDGDGRWELAYSLIDLTKDAAWHVVVHDALSGKVVADLAGCYLDGLIDLDGDGRRELLLSDSAGLALPTHRPLRVASFAAGRLRERWRGQGRLHQRFDGRVSPNVAEQLPFHDPVCGDLDGDGRDELFVSRRDGSSEQCDAYGFDAGGKVTALASVSWPRDVAADVLAVADADGDGRREVLLRCRVSSGEPVLRSRDCGLELASWTRPSPRDLVGPPIVADLAGNGRPVVVAPKAWGRVSALRVSASGKGVEELWSIPGRGMSLIYEHQHGGVAAADLDGDGRREVICAGEGPGGAACVQAVGASGTPRWRHELRQIQWAPTRGWGPGALRTWSVGRFRRAKPPDVYVSAHLNEMHSGTSTLLDGRDGSRVWERECLKGRVKEMGGGHVSIADVEGDGLEEIAGGYCNFLFALDGTSGTVRSAVHSASLFQPVMKGSWISSTTPLLLDADGDGKPEMLLGRHRLIAALLDGDARRVRWSHPHRSGSYSMPGVADVDGDGQLEVGVVGRGDDGARLSCLDLATGKVEWQMAVASPAVTDFASGDVDGDGLAEFVFAVKATVVAVNGRGGKAHLVWKLSLPAACGPPIVADVDGDGCCEILLVGGDGILRCIDGR